MAELDPLQELNHYYQGCILKYPIDDFNFPFYVDSFECGKKGDFRATGSVGIIRNGNLMWTPTTLDASDLEYTHPELGCVNINKSVIYVRRTPDRQYKKALNERVLQITHLVPLLSNIEGAYNMRIVNRDILNVSYCLFNQKYLEINNILDKINNFELYAGAFSKDFYIFPHSMSNKLIVGHKQHSVGWIQGDKIHLPVRNDYLIQELSQHMEIEVVK